MGQMLLDVEKRKPKPSAASQVKAWLATRRRIQREFHTFWMRSSRELDQAKLDLCEEVSVMSEDFEPHILDFLKFGWVDDILEWKKDRDEEQKAAEEEAELWRLEQDRAAGSQDGGGPYCPPPAIMRYRTFFCQAAGRNPFDGPPGIACDQPDMDDKVLWDENDWVSWWLELGGYTDMNQADQDGWTPLHHAIECMVHWDQAWLVAQHLIDAMEVKWLSAKTTGGIPAHRHALHFLATNSDRVGAKAELVPLIVDKTGEPDPVDDRDRTPLMLAVGSGQVDVAKAMVAAGADPHRMAADGRTLANRCKGSSGSMRAWVQNDLGIQVDEAAPGGRYRPQGHMSASRQGRHDQRQAMLAAESQGGSKGRPGKGRGSGSAASGSRAASSGARPSDRPRLETRATPTHPRGPARSSWEWYWDTERQRWSWYWTDIRPSGRSTED